jgi:hypothetical protein
MAHEIMPGAMGRDPKTDAEWQEAANAALFCRMLESCFAYGILTGPAINSERCQWILDEAKKRGIDPVLEIRSVIGSPQKDVP